MTGDLSPSYSGLSAKRIAYIVNAFAKRGIETKAVFILRDPVERCISAAAMEKRKYPTEGTLDELLQRKHKTSNFEFRTRYMKTIEAADQR